MTFLAGALVVSQTDEVQLQIAELIAALKALHQREKEKSKSEPLPPAIMPGSSPRGVDMICKLVEPKSWSKPDANIGLVPGAIVVRQTLEVHRRIDRLLGPGGLGSVIRAVPTMIGPTNARGSGGGFGGNARH